MQARILFTSLTWNKELWGKNFYLCNELDSEQEFNGFHFCRDKTKAITLHIDKAYRIAGQISTRATVAVI